MSLPDDDNTRWLSSRAAAFTRIEHLRNARARAVPLSEVFEALEEAFLCARRLADPSTSSGLIAQQAWFMKGRK
ncbi:MAG: hypothetical protein JW741_08745 [Sedimentisphaerales bacterium]|nr:hypothetical protein [Sedimentisphaerales bacterium]